MRTTILSSATALLAAVTLPSVADAQNQRTGTAYGSTWSWYYYETGAGDATVLTGRPSMWQGQREAIITMMTRDGRALNEADRPYAIGVAQALCEQGGRRFNTQTRGHWLENGGLGFQGACTRW
ncbi:MAG: hypothetical protein KDK12_16415 [Rhodobacteraceae bacterium]|nr:hypothetical protein [Paracoccaceae bacterium]